MFSSVPVVVISVPLGRTHTMVFMWPLTHERGEPGALRPPAVSVLGVAVTLAREERVKRGVGRSEVKADKLLILQEARTL